MYHYHNDKGDFYEINSSSRMDAIKSIENSYKNNIAHPISELALFTSIVADKAIENSTKNKSFAKSFVKKLKR